MTVQRSNMYRYHENIRKLRMRMIFSLVTERLMWLPDLGWWKTAEWVAMMRKCGRRHTVISLSISTLGFYYFADAHTIPLLLSLEEPNWVVKDKFPFTPLKGNIVEFWCNVGLNLCKEETSPTESWVIPKASHLKSDGMGLGQQTG